MKQLTESTAVPLHRVQVHDVLARDVRTGADLLARARGSRHPELAQILAFAAARRLRRGPVGGAKRPASRTAGPRAALPPAQGSPAASAAAPQPVKQQTPRLIQRQPVTDDLLRLMVSRPDGFRYRAGQHVKLGLPGLLRTYSLVSAPHETRLEFFVEVLAGGRLSQRLRALPPGTPIAMAERAKGDLHLDTRYPNQLLIATVAGIAPYVSLVRDHLHRFGSRRGVRLVLLHGASHAAELGYAEELAELSRRHPDQVVYVPTVSRPESPRNAGWTGARGRVETHIEPLMTRLGLHAGNTAVFACGHPDMVSNVSRGFRRRGFAVQTEPFD